MSTLLGRLAQLGSFSMQGELLCTQGLTYVLQKHPNARSVLATEVKTHTGVSVSNDLTWRAEVVQQQDRGRTDLEGRTSDGTAMVKIEAKLGAHLSRAQLESYVKHFQLSVAESARVLLVLVPRARTDEAKNIVTDAFGRSGQRHWQSGKVAITVVSWEDLLAKLRENESDSLCRFEVEQLEAMYRVLSGNDIQPLTGPDQLRDWRARETDFVNLVERATRGLTKKHASHRVYPMSVEKLELAPPEGLEDKGYRRRYVCLALQESESCFSIGVRDPFARSDPPTPIWLRFHHETPLFSVIRDRLEGSDLAKKLFKSGKDVWLPLDVPIRVDAAQMVNELVAQAEKVMQVAYQAKP
jgi:hypothetical protein